MLVSFLGAPGSGKGSQARFLSESYGFVHISTGDLLRDEISRKTSIGLEIEKALSKGALGDKIVVDAVNVLLLESLKTNADRNIILDGFPRLLHQCADLELIVNQMPSLKIGCIIEFVAPYEVLEKRIVGRYTCSTCKAVYHKDFNKPVTEGVCNFCRSTQFDQRKDDTPEVFKKRFQAYVEQLEPIRGFYQERKLYDSVDAAQGIPEIGKALCLVLERRGILK